MINEYFFLFFSSFDKIISESVLGMEIHGIAQVSERVTFDNPFFPSSTSFFLYFFLSFFI